MTDRRVIFTVTMFLGLVVLGGLGSVVALALFHQPVPELIGNVTTAALGALSALLVSTRVDPGQLPAAEPSVESSPTTANERYIAGRLADQARAVERGKG